MTTVKSWLEQLAHWALSQRIVDAQQLIPAYVISGVILVALLIRRHRGWLRTLAVWVPCTTIIGAIILLIAEKGFNIAGGPLPDASRWWIIGFFAALGVALANFRWSTWKRKIGAVLAIVVFLATTVLGVNKVFGIDQTLGALVGRPQGDQISLPALNNSARVDASMWTAPTGMPSTGETGYVHIPATASGFDAREAGIYLPPAALMANAPKLPVMVMMMGQPGNPDPTSVSQILDAYASTHQGLAPIVVFADQLADPDHDTLCLDTDTYGNVQTYVNTDVVNWIKDNLNVSTDRSDWTIAGYSNGGQCSISFGIKYPDIWGNILDISGELYPGEEHPDWNLENIFNNDQSAYDAVKPENIMAQNSYPDTWAYFSYGTEDSTFGPAAVTLSQDAQNAGMTVKLDALEGAGHLQDALEGGFTNGLDWFSDRLQLSAAAR